MSTAPRSHRAHVLLVGALAACGGSAEPVAPEPPAPPDLLRCDRTPGKGCFVRVEGGAFWLGAQASDASAPGFDPAAPASALPPVRTSVGTFWMQADEVLATQVAQCQADGACDLGEVLAGSSMATVGMQGNADLPAAGLTWRGAEQVCAWWGGRLPTEAEWAFATRGADGRAYPWGDDPGCGRRGKRASTHPGAPPLSCREPRPPAVSDLRTDHPLRMRGLVGSLWEWTSTDAPGGLKVQRGPSYLHDAPAELHAASRQPLPPHMKLPDVGVRCAWASTTP